MKPLNPLVAMAVLIIMSFIVAFPTVLCLFYHHYIMGILIFMSGPISFGYWLHIRMI
jgi:hypothetical protein